MLINGEEVGDNQVLISLKLFDIPSSFPEYNSNIAPKMLSPEELHIQGQAIYSYNDGLDLQNKGNHTEAIVKLKQAEEIAGKVDNVLSSYINAKMAHSYEAVGDFGNAIKKLQDSINNAFESKKYYDIENLSKELVETHQKQGTLDEFIKTQESTLTNNQAENVPGSELIARLGLGAAYKAQDRLDDSIEHYAQAYSLQQGKLDYDAVRVEQHEVGFSDKEKIGTDNIRQCVAVILHDPLTKKTALAHVDKNTDANSLTNDVISKFPPEAKLEAYLVGGLSRDPSSMSISDENINKVIKELNKHSNINIKAADIGNKGAPSGIVFDPLTAKLEHAIPAKEDKTTAIRQTAITIGANAAELYTAFDFTESKTIPERVLTKNDKKNILNRYLMLERVDNNEMWQANQISRPLTKAAIELRDKDPLLVAEVLAKDSLPEKSAIGKMKDYIIDSISSFMPSFTIPKLIIKFDMSEINDHSNLNNNSNKTENIGISEDGVKRVEPLKPVSDKVRAMQANVNVKIASTRNVTPSTVPSSINTPNQNKNRAR